MKKIPIIIAILGVLAVLLLHVFSANQKPTYNSKQLRVPYESPVPGEHHHVIAPPAESHSPLSPAPAKQDDSTKLMQAAISIIVLLAALWVILSGKYQEAQTHWAFGAIGSIITFWLKV
jgi:hypothetical protein